MNIMPENILITNYESDNPEVKILYAGAAIIDDQS